MTLSSKAVLITDITQMYYSKKLRKICLQWLEE